MLLSVISRVQRGRAELANRIQFTRPLATRNRGRPGPPASLLPGPPASLLPGPSASLSPGSGRRPAPGLAATGPRSAAATTQLRRLQLPRSGACNYPGPAAAAAQVRRWRPPRPQPGGSQRGTRFPSAPGRLRARSGVRRRGRGGAAIMLSTDQLNGSPNGAHSSGVSAPGDSAVLSIGYEDIPPEGLARVSPNEFNGHHSTT
jgi:hypothetical protein